jgi:hypothetical protein
MSIGIENAVRYIVENGGGAMKIQQNNNTDGTHSFLGED